jgi:hypothetical protein
MGQNRIEPITRRTHVTGAIPAVRAHRDATEDREGRGEAEPPPAPKRRPPAPAPPDDGLPHIDVRA